MVFNTSSAFDIQKKDVKFLDAGIHENVSLEKVRYDKSPNGNEFIEFTFSKDGAAMTHTEYAPQKYNDQTEEEFNSKVNKQVSRILQIMEVFYDRSKLSFQADSFATFASWVVALMSNIDKTQKVRIKVVYSNTGYTTLPKYAVYTFIESMNVSAEKSKIKKLGIDSFTRPETSAPDNEEPSQSAASVFSTPVVAEVQSGMPF